MKTLKIVPQYDGHKNISVWLERFMECAETLREDKQAMLPLVLSGEAAIVFSFCTKPETVVGQFCFPTT